MKKTLPSLLLFWSGFNYVINPVRFPDPALTSATATSPFLTIDQQPMPVDYKLRTLRRLFGESNFLRATNGKPVGKMKRYSPNFVPLSAAENVPTPDTTSSIIREPGTIGGDDSISIQEDLSTTSSVSNATPKSQQTPIKRKAKPPGGLSKPFFSNQPPRSIKGKAVAGHLWGLHLWEKQKMKVYYGAMGDKQFRRYVEKAKNCRVNTDAALMKFLELRLDTFLYRTGFVKSPMQARQWIFHNQVCVNARAVNVKNFPMTPGDVLTIRQGFEEHAYAAQQAAAEYRASFNIGPSWIASRSDVAGMLPWMEIDRVGLAAALVRYPTDQELRALQNAALLPYIRDANLNPHAAMRAYR